MNPNYPTTNDRATLDTPQRDGVMSYCNLLEKSVENIHEALCVLAVRLSPILPPSGPIEALDSKPEYPCDTSEVVLKLCNILNDFSGAESRIREITEYVQV